MNKENNTVGSRIGECRKEMGYSREILAAMLYMKKTTICKYERDEHDILQVYWWSLPRRFIPHRTICFSETSKLTTGLMI